MAGLEVIDLAKRLGGNQVVNGVSFQIDEGEFFVLLGPSGGGKTTILRLICGLEYPDRGQILIDGRDATRLPSRERNLGMVFQEYGLYPNMDVSRNIAYGLEARGMRGDEVRKRVTQAAEILGLGEMLNLPITDLSGGEQQRVALARAMAKDASAYLYDEPLSNLDPKLRYHARRNIQEIHRRKQKPSLYVTHDQSEALAMADRIAVIANGRLQQVGKAEELVDNPENMFVARFIGSPPMNLMSGAVTRREGRYQVVADGVSVTLPPTWRQTLDGYGKDRVILGIRPDTLTRDGKGDIPTANGDSIVAGEVRDVEPLIGETVVTLSLAGGGSLVGVFQEGWAEQDSPITPGETIRASIDADHVCLFDPDSERALGRWGQG